MESDDGNSKKTLEFMPPKEETRMRSELQIFLQLPKELWKFQIWTFFSFQQKQVLRRLCRFFRYLFYQHPVWKQWIPFEQVDSYISTCQRISLPFSIYGIKGNLKEMDATIASRFCRFNLHSMSLSFSEADLGKLPNGIEEIHVPAGITFGGLSQIATKFNPKIFGRIAIAYSVPLVASHLGHLATLFAGKAYVEFPEHMSLLYAACSTGQVEAVKTILEKDGARYINTRSTNFGESALYWCCDHGFLKLTEMLLEYGADCNLPCYDTDSPLIIACYNNHLEIVRLLLKYGVQIQYRDRDGERGLDVARNQGHSEIVMLLEEAHRQQQIVSKMKK